MEGRRQRGYDPNVLRPAKRLRRNLEDLFAGNDISGMRAHGLLQDASAAGVADAQAVRGIRHPANMPRSLRRKMLKGSLWPRDYVARVRTWDPKAEEEVLAELHLLLPHEVLARLVVTSSLPVLADREGMDSISRAHLEACDHRAGPGAPLVGIGVGGEAVPCTWDRSESLQVLSWNLPGLTGAARTLRFPVTGIAKKNVLTLGTHHDIMDVLRWSLQALASGVWPATRHDGSPFQLDEASRTERPASP